MATPNITLTATLLDYSGNELGSATQPAWLRIALCGFGPTLPCVVGTANLGKISSWFVDIPYVGVPLTGGTAIKLWGNDQITPAGTYYAISILDTQKNVLQTGIYQFTGGPLTIDLSNAVQIVPPFGFPLSLLQVKGCTPNPVSAPGTTVFTAAGAVIVIAVFYNGVLMRPTTDYTVAGNVITLTFGAEIGDNVYALCVA